MNELPQEERDTRRRMAIADLVPANTDPNETKILISRLADAVLVVTGRNDLTGKVEVEVAHEALIRHWTRLRTWLDEDLANLRTRDGVSEAAKEWEKNPEDESLLVHRGTRLEIAEELLRSMRLPLTKSEREYILACVQTRDRDRIEKEIRQKQDSENAKERQKLAEARESAERSARAEVQRRLEDRARAVRISRFLTTFLAVACLAAIISALLAYRQSRTSFSKQLAAQSLSNREQHLDRALLLALQAESVAQNVDTRTAMLAGMLEHPSLEGYLRGHTSEALALAFDQTGNVLVSGHFDISVDLWDVKARSRLPLQELTSSSVSAIALSADGRILAVGASGEIKVLERRDRSWTPSSPPNYPTGAGADLTWYVSALALNSAGTKMSSAFCFQENNLDEPDNRCSRSEIDIWQIGKAVPQRVLKLDGPEIKALAFQPDGALLIANPAGLFSWDYEHRNQPMKFEALSGATPLYIAMSRTGQPVACGTRNGDIVCWDVSSKTVISEFASAHSGPIDAITACLDSHILASSATDGTLLLWNTDQHQRIARTIKLANTRFTGGIAFINDERLLAGSEGSAVIVDFKGGSQTSLAGKGPTIRAIAVSPDRSEVAFPEDQAVAVWRLSDPPTLARVLPIDSDYAWQVAFRTDGKVLASGSQNGKVYRWDLSDNSKNLPPLVTNSDHDGEQVVTLAFSPDGQVLAAGGTSATLRFFDANTGRLLRAKKMPDSIRQLAFAPDGRSLAFGLSGGQVGIIDQNLKKMQYPLTSPEEFGGALQYSSNGLLLAWICADGTTKVWDLRENRLLGTLPGSEPGLDGGIAFSNDSKLLAVSGPDGTVLIWNLDEKSWTSQACAIAGRDLTQAEWDQFVGGRKVALCGVRAYQP